MAVPALTRLPGRIALQALAAALRRRMLAEWRGSALHRSTLAAPKPEGFSVQPRDLRPADRENGARLLAGSFVFAGSALHPGPGADPWDRPSPSRRFAVALHRFIWLRDLLAEGEAGGAEALRLILEWSRLFGTWNSFAWRPDVLERRVFNLACGARSICAGASEAETAALALDLARQARFLLRASDGPARAAERAVAAGVAGAALSGRAGETLLSQALARVAKTLPQAVDADGGHASRSPQAALELLFDLQTLDGALEARGLAAPDAMMRAIDRLSGAVRFFTLADGGLPDFHGGEETRPAYVAAAGANAEGADRPIPAARNGYQRIEGRNLQLVADAGRPAEGPWSVAACAQPLAIEVLVGGRRLIVNSGWSPDAVGPAALRIADAASTATLGDQSCGEPMRGFVAEALGPRLAGVYQTVTARRQEAENGRWLEMTHDGWVPRFGLRHERRLYVDAAAGELRGEDRFTPAGPGGGGRKFAPFMVRFHVHPDVHVSRALDRRSVLLRTHPQDVGWWLRNDAVEVEIEPSVYFQQGQARRTSQVVLRGQARLDAGARVRWKLSAAEVWPPPR